MKQLSSGQKVTLKCILIVLVVAYMIFCCFPCVEIIRTSASLEALPTVSQENNFSIFTMAALVLQLIAIALDRSVFQLVCGVCGTISGLLLPISIKLESVLRESIVYIRAPDHYTESVERSVTSAGWVLAAFSAILIAVDVFFAVAMKKSSATATEEDAGKKSRTKSVLWVCGVIFLLLLLLVFKDQLSAWIYDLTRPLCY